MDPPERAMDEVSRKMKGRKWLVELAGVYNLVYSAQLGIQRLFIPKGNPNIEGYTSRTKSFGLWFLNAAQYLLVHMPIISS